MIELRSVKKTKYFIIAQYYIPEESKFLIVSSAKLFDRIHFFVYSQKLSRGFYTLYDEYFYFVVPSFEKIPPKNLVEQWLANSSKIPIKLHDKFIPAYVYKFKIGFLVIDEYDIALGSPSNNIPYGVKGLVFKFKDSDLCDYFLEKLLNKINDFYEELMFILVSEPLSDGVRKLLSSLLFGSEMR